MKLAKEMRQATKAGLINEKKLSKKRVEGVWDVVVKEIRDAADKGRAALVLHVSNLGLTYVDGCILLDRLEVEGFSAKINMEGTIHICWEEV